MYRYRLATTCFVTGFLGVLLQCDVLQAQQQRGRARGSERFLDGIFRAPRGVTLNDQQKEKLAELRKTRGPGFAKEYREIQNKIRDVYTDDQRRASQDAFRKAREAGKSRQECQQAANAAANLSDEQTKKLQDLRSASQKLLADVQSDINETLGIRPQRRRNRTRVAPTHANVKYGPHERNVLDFWKAESRAPTPLLVSIHGGGFRGGNKSVRGNLLSQCLDNGISVAAITYRFSQHAIAPASFHDSARAIQFLRSKAGEWNIDPERLACTGGSAGAGLSLWLGFHDDLADPDIEDPVLRQSTRLTCMFVYNGQTSYDPRFIRELFQGTDTYKHSALAQLFGVNLDELDDLPEVKYRLFEEVSALPHLTKDDPPVILIYNGPLEAPITNQSVGIHHARFGEALQKKMKALGIECEVHAAGKRLGGGEPTAPIDFLKKHFGLAAGQTR